MSILTSRDTRETFSASSLESCVKREVIAAEDYKKIRKGNTLMCLENTPDNYKPVHVKADSYAFFFPGSAL